MKVVIFLLLFSTLKEMTRLHVSFRFCKFFYLHGGTHKFPSCWAEKGNIIEGVFIILWGWQHRGHSLWYLWHRSLSIAWVNYLITCLFRYCSWGKKKSSTRSTHPNWILVVHDWTSDMSLVIFPFTFMLSWLELINGVLPY